jgi:hypothetical protein
MRPESLLMTMVASDGGRSPCRVRVAGEVAHLPRGSPPPAARIGREPVVRRSHEPHLQAVHHQACGEPSKCVGGQRRQTASAPGQRTPPLIGAKPEARAPPPPGSRDRAPVPAAAARRHQVPRLHRQRSEASTRRTRLRVEALDIVEQAVARLAAVPGAARNCASHGTRADFHELAARSRGVAVAAEPHASAGRVR